MAAMPGMAADMPTLEPDASQPASASMAGMASEGWTWDGFVSLRDRLGVMMAAMMFPAAAPMLLLYRTWQWVAVLGGAFVPTWVFAAGYLLVWVGRRRHLGARATRERCGWPLRGSRPAPLGAGGAGIVLLGAGLYQFTSLKGMCLRQCQSPVGFVMTHWRDGYRGALRMGVVHGLFCLGCCWALFAVLVAAGVMSLAWMLLLTLVVFLEKVVPRVEWGSRAVGVAFVALGLVVMAGAVDMPWVA